MRCELNAACISIRIDKAQRLACAACFERVVATIAVNYYHIHVHDTRFLVREGRLHEVPTNPGTQMRP